MDNKTNKPSGTPPIQWLEGDLFDALVGFHKKVIALLGAANLDDDKSDIATERLKLLTATHALRQGVVLVRDQSRRQF